MCLKINKQANEQTKQSRYQKYAFYVRKGKIHEKFSKTNNKKINLTHVVCGYSSVVGHLLACMRPSAESQAQSQEKKPNTTNYHSGMKKREWEKGIERYRRGEE